MTLRRRAHDEITLPIDMVDFLLNVDRSAAEIDDLQAGGTKYDHFLQFDEWSDDQIDQLWREHGRQLRDEAGGAASRCRQDAGEGGGMTRHSGRDPSPASRGCR